MPAACVLDEDGALELLAYLITAARTQVDEAAEYAPMRLLTAAHRLAESMGPETSQETSAFLNGPLQQMPLLAVPRVERDGYAERDGYVERLDDLCRALAEHLTARYGSSEGSA